MRREALIFFSISNLAFATCHFLKERCVESGWKTFVVDGTSVSIYKDCWKWEKVYVCSEGTSQNTCSIYESNPSRYSLVSKNCLVDRYGIGCEVEKRVYSEKVSDLTCGNFAYSKCVNQQSFTFSNLVPPFTVSNVCTEEDRYYYCITSTKDYCQPYESSCSLAEGPTCTKWENGVCKLYAHYYKCGAPPSGDCKYLGKTCTNQSTKTIEDETINACWTYTYQYSCQSGTVDNCQPYETNPNCSLVKEECSDGTCERTYRCLIKEDKICSEWQTKTYCSEDICNPDSPSYDPILCQRNQTDFSQYFGATAYLYMLNEIRKDFACAGDVPSTPSTEFKTSIVCSDGVTACTTSTAYVCQSSPNKTNLATDGKIEYCIQQNGNWICPYRNEPCIKVSVYNCPSGGYCYPKTEEIEQTITAVTDYPSKLENVGCLDPNYCAETAVGEENVSTPNVAGSCELRIFPGIGLKCRKPGIQTGFANCCSDGTGNAWGIFGDICNENEKTLAQKRANGLCHYVGEYCSVKLETPFGDVCLQKKKSFCCFNSKLARIIHEQARPQLGISWGSPKSPNCRGFTIEEITKIDWTKIDFSEYIADIQTKTNLSIEGFNLNPNEINIPTLDLTNFMQDYYENLNTPSNPPTTPEE